MLNYRKVFQGQGKVVRFDYIYLDNDKFRLRLVRNTILKKLSFVQKP